MTPRTVHETLARSRRGAVGMLVALMSMAIFATAGFAIDAARIMYVRERLISALDAAALAGGRVVNSSASSPGCSSPRYQCDAQTYFALNFKPNYFGSSYFFNTSLSSFSANLSPDGTQLAVSASVTMPLLFGRFLGYSGPMSIGTTAKALAGKIEVVLVLDNSGSMADTVSGDSQPKITLLKQAAGAFVQSLTQLGNNNVRIAVVPFTAFVNVGASNAAQSWLDPTAGYIYPSSGNTTVNPYTGQPFSDVFTDGTGKNYQVKRFTLFNNLATTLNQPSYKWAGCVEMRPAITYNGVTTHYDTQDIPAKTSDPNSLFVPAFAPSEPTFLSYPNWNTKNSGSYPEFYNSYLQDYSTEDQLVSTYTQQYLIYQAFQNPAPVTATDFLIQQGDYRKYTSPTASGYSYGTGKGSYAVGPNAGCMGYDALTGASMTVQQVQPLTLNMGSSPSDTTSGTVYGAINGMRAMGDTYLPIGLAWGWQTLSPNSVFNSGAASYTDPDVSKVVILLTDGCNHALNPNRSGGTDTCGNYLSLKSSTSKTYFPDASTYSSTGYIWQNRFGPPSSNPQPSSDANLDLEQDREAVADAQTLSICQNMRAVNSNISVYAIGIDTEGASNPVLKNCSPYYYSVPDPSQLQSIFLQIATQLTTVRIIPTSVPSN